MTRKVTPTYRPWPVFVYHFTSLFDFFGLGHVLDLLRPIFLQIFHNFQGPNLRILLFLLQGRGESDSISCLSALNNSAGSCCASQFLSGDKDLSTCVSDHLFVCSRLFAFPLLGYLKVSSFFSSLSSVGASFIGQWDLAFFFFFG